MSAVKKMNIVDIENGLEELTALNLSPVDYGKALVTLFGSTTTLKRLGTNKTNTSEFDNGLLWRDKLHYVPCSPGEINQTLEDVKASDKTLKGKVRLVIVYDGSHILVFDRKYNELIDCTVDTIKDEPQLFLPLIGLEGFRREVENDVDIKATGKLAKLYDALIERNPEWLIGDKRHALNHFMIQIIFCLFAEDTSIFPKGIFTKALKNRAGVDGEHTTNVIADIFSVLDVDDSKRENIAPWLSESKFPYVNGGLFKGAILVPEFTAKAHRYLIETASLDWKHINPDILGSSIQAIVDPTMRGNLGMHYTSVPNILKTLEPLFLNELRDELLKARHAKKLINVFLERLSKIVVFDPACGSGNFLVIAYRELRKLELQALDALRDLEGGASLAFSFGSVISLSNFYGIEYADFAAETAKLALWIAEYQQNARFVAAFGADIPALPLKDSGKILCGNSLRIEWDNFCPSKPEMQVFLVGNPPYLGSTWMEKSQKADMDIVFSPYNINYKTLDYVCGWFIKGAEYCAKNTAQFAFVATNTITQGGHVSLLWPLIFDKNLEISFAHKSFKWKNNAASNAGVTCVIIGIRKLQSGQKYLFDGIHIKNAQNINGYLLDSENIAIIKSSRPINFLPSMDFGSKPADGGNLILSRQEVDELVSDWPESKDYIRKFLGSNEVINGKERFCLWIDDSLLDKALQIKPIRDRVDKTFQMRSASKKTRTQEDAQKSHKFSEVRLGVSDTTIVIPRVSSETRDYLPVSLLTNGEIISDRNFGIYDGPLWCLALIVSRMHWIWIGTVCVRLEERFSYSNTLGWNTFPIRKLNIKEQEALNQTARNILLTRESFFPKSIAELYDREKMPDALKTAHQENDQLLESFYRDRPFENDEERLSHLFERYIEMTKGLEQ